MCMLYVCDDDARVWYTPETGYNLQTNLRIYSKHDEYVNKDKIWKLFRLFCTTESRYLDASRHRNRCEEFCTRPINCYTIPLKIPKNRCPFSFIRLFMPVHFATFVLKIDSDMAGATEIIKLNYSISFEQIVHFLIELAQPVRDPFLRIFSMSCN